MPNRFHRIASNSNGWTRPSPGRLGNNGNGPYVQENGFGHEDWNFRYTFSNNGILRGYTVGRPANIYRGEIFNIILAIYEDRFWYAVGYYENAVFLENPPEIVESVISKMAADVHELAQQGSAAERFLRMDLDEISAEIQCGHENHIWSIQQDNVISFHEPVIIPNNLYTPVNAMFTRSFEITHEQFTNITELGNPIR